jgi:hypothetical protein
MPLPPIAADLMTIVVTGDLRPVIISPAWLRDRDLIGDAEVQQARFELLIPSEAAIFEAGWLRCQANPQSLQFETKNQPEFERLRDLAVGVLRGFPDMPIMHMGINRNVHFTVNDLGAWHSVGDQLVHNEIWDDVLHLAGMRSVTYWGVRTDGYGGRIHVQVEPSVRYPPGVFLAYNDHYDLSRTEVVPENRVQFTANSTENNDVTAEKISVAVEVLTNDWADSMRRFNDVFGTLSAKVDVTYA